MSVQALIGVAYLDTSNATSVHAILLQVITLSLVQCRSPPCALPPAVPLSFLHVACAAALPCARLLHRLLISCLLLQALLALVLAYEGFIRLLARKFEWLQTPAR